MNWKTYKQHKKKLGEVNVFWTQSNALKQEADERARQVIQIGIV